jgi:hypothetical protein
MKLLLIHNPTQSKICNEKVRIVLWRAKQKVFGLKVAMYDAVIVQVSNCRKDCPY